MKCSRKDILVLVRRQECNNALTLLLQISALKDTSKTNRSTDMEI